MNATGTFLTGIGLTLLISAVVVLCLRRSLCAILVDLCGTVPRAEFWTAFSTVLLILTPLVFAMTLRQPPSAETVFSDIILQLRLALAGLIAALLILGVFLCVFIFAKPPAQ